MKKTMFKKSISLIMTVLMIMSCWVWVAPIEAEAAASTPTGFVNTESLNGLTVPSAVTMTTTFNNRYKTTDNGNKGDTNTSDATDARLKESYQNVINFNNGNTVTSSTGAAATFTGVPGATTFRIWYPDTVLMYDGSTTPTMTITLDADANSGQSIKFISAYMTGEIDGFHLGKTASDNFWYGRATNDSAVMYC